MTDNAKTKAAAAGVVTEQKPVHTPRRWGLDADKVMQKLQGKMVAVRLVDGSTLTGQLCGYDEYNLVLRCSDGVKVVGKGHAMSWEPSKGQNGAASVSG